MRNQSGTKNKLCTYLDDYMENIYGRLKEIDIFIKSSEGEMELWEVSKLLEISCCEVHGIMCSKNFSEISRENFCKIMASGSSRICQTYNRELEIGAPPFYTRENISYIYDIDIDKINKACDNLSLKEITWYTLPTLFAAISLDNY